MVVWKDYQKVGYLVGSMAMSLVEHLDGCSDDTMAASTVLYLVVNLEDY